MTERYLILKRGLYECPDHMGYTAYKNQAGRYPKETADAHTSHYKNPHMAVLEEDAPEIAPGAREGQKAEYWEMKWRMAQMEIGVLRGVIEDGRERHEHDNRCSFWFGMLAAGCYLAMIIAYHLK